MKPTPSDWPRLSVSMHYKDPAKAIDWLCAAFGLELRLKVEGEAGEIVHSELSYGEAVVMVSAEGGWNARPDLEIFVSPRSIEGRSTSSMMVYVDDVQAHHDRAKAAGATILMELHTSDYGEDYWSDRGYGCADLEGHVWYFSQRLRSPGEK